MAYLADSSGYYFRGPSNSNDTFVEKKEDYVINLIKGTKIFLNCGGTLVSTPNFPNTEGVRPYGNLLNNQNVKSKLELSKCSYKDVILKLSEKWRLEDYLHFKAELIKIKTKGYNKIIISYGTDSISFFAPWVDLLSQEYNLKCVILIGQRSLDKPTCQLLTLLDSALVLVNTMSEGSATVLTFGPKGVSMHNCFEIKKYHTTAVGAFYSKNQRLFTPTQLKPPSFRFKTKFKTINHVTELKPVQINFENPFYSSSHKDILICRGVGNTNIQNSTSYLSTCTSSGPLNSYMYNSKNLNLEPFENLNPSWEALFSFKALLL